MEEGEETADSQGGSRELVHDPEGLMAYTTEGDEELAGRASQDQGSDEGEGAPDRQKVFFCAQKIIHSY